MGCFGERAEHGVAFGGGEVELPGGSFDDVG